MPQGTHVHVLCIHRSHGVV